MAGTVPNTCRRWNGRNRKNISDESGSLTVTAGLLAAPGVPVEFLTAIRVGTASTEALLRRFTRDASHPVLGIRASFDRHNLVTIGAPLSDHKIRWPALRFALALCLALAASGAASSTAQASKACKSESLDGGLLYNIVATGTGCTTARNVARTYNVCINNGGGRVKPCNRRVEGFTCSAKRRWTATKQYGQVTCRLARKTVRFSYRKVLVE